MRQFLLPQRMHTRQVDFASDDLRPGGREHFFDAASTAD